MIVPGQMRRFTAAASKGVDAECRQDSLNKASNYLVVLVYNMPTIVVSAKGI